MSSVSLEDELYNAGLQNSAYFKKHVDYCNEFLRLFPGASDLTIHNTRRAIADSYSRLGDHAQAESEFAKLVQDYLDNPWGYIGWGDLYLFDKKADFDRAKELYLKALAIAKDDFDIAAVQERLEDLEVCPKCSPVWQGRRHGHISEHLGPPRGLKVTMGEQPGKERFPDSSWPFGDRACLPRGEQADSGGRRRQDIGAEGNLPNGAKGAIHGVSFGTEDA